MPQLDKCRVYIVRPYLDTFNLALYHLSGGFVYDFHFQWQSERQELMILVYSFGDASCKVP